MLVFDVKMTLPLFLLIEKRPGNFISPSLGSSKSSAIDFIKLLSCTFLQVHTIAAPHPPLELHSVFLEEGRPSTGNLTFRIPT